MKNVNQARQGNALIFVKQRTRIVNETKNMLKVLAKELLHSTQQNKRDKITDDNMKVPRSTLTGFTLKLDGILSFNM